MSEQREQHGAQPYPAGFEPRRPVKSFGRTVYEVLVHPHRFYSRLETERSEYPAMVFLYVLAALAALLALSVEATTGSRLLYVEFFGGPPNAPGFFVEGMGAREILVTIVGLALLFPLGVIVGDYIWAFVVHALAWLWMGRKAGNVKHTFRVIAYANTVGLAALVVPFLGGLLATAWALYLLVIGVRRLNPRAAGFSNGQPESAPAGALD